MSYLYQAIVGEKFYIFDSKSNSDHDQQKLMKKEADCIDFSLE